MIRYSAHENGVREYCTAARGRSCRVGYQPATPSIAESVGCGSLNTAHLRQTFYSAEMIHTHRLHHGSGRPHTSTRGESVAARNGRYSGLHVYSCRSASDAMSGKAHRY